MFGRLESRTWAVSRVAETLTLLRTLPTLCRTPVATSAMPARREVRLSSLRSCSTISAVTSRSRASPGCGSAAGAGFWLAQRLLRTHITSLMFYLLGLGIERSLRLAGRPGSVRCPLFPARTDPAASIPDRAQGGSTWQSVGARREPSRAKVRRPEFRRRASQLGLDAEAQRNPEIRATFGFRPSDFGLPSGSVLGLRPSPPTGP